MKLQVIDSPTELKRFSVGAVINGKVYHDRRFAPSMSHFEARWLVINATHDRDDVLELVRQK